MNKKVEEIGLVTYFLVGLMAFIGLLGAWAMLKWIRENLLKFEFTD